MYFFIPSLRNRRLFLSLCSFYCIVNGLVHFPHQSIVHHPTMSSSRYYNPHSYIVPYARCNALKFSFFCTVIRLWNFLPLEALTAEQLLEFKHFISPLFLIAVYIQITLCGALYILAIATMCSMHTLQKFYKKNKKKKKKSLHNFCAGCSSYSGLVQLPRTAHSSASCSFSAPTCQRAHGTRVHRERYGSGTPGRPHCGTRSLFYRGDQPRSAPPPAPEVEQLRAGGQQTC